VTVLRPPLTRYRDAHPVPTDVLLLVEVPDATVSFDRRHKMPLYAAAGVTECWLFDLPSQRIEVYRSPRDRSYLEVERYGREGRLSPLAFPDVELAAADLLP